MARYKDAFVRYLDRRGVKYKVNDERRVQLTYNTDNKSDITVKVIFDEDDDGWASIRCWDICNIKESRVDQAIALCNKLNAEYRWVKFCIDKDNDVSAEIDVISDLDSVGPECLELVMRMVNICDEAYPEFMRIMWG